jgi:molybdate transport system substrate-binding protein
MSRFGLPWLLSFISVYFCAGPAAPQEINVAAASDLTDPLREIAANFQKKSGTQVKISFGSSGNLSAQIANGAPFDVFFSADIAYPRKLEADGLAEPGSIYQYAVGRIVLWAPKNAKVDVSRGMSCLTDPEVKRIAIANPAHAPYGRAAVTAMTTAQVYSMVKEKLVTGENVAEAALFVDSENAQVGIIALSLALSPKLREKGRYWEVPLESYPRIEQGVTIVKSSHNKEVAKAFLDYVRSPEGASILKRYGFFLPEA